MAERMSEYEIRVAALNAASRLTETKHLIGGGVAVSTPVREIIENAKRFAEYIETGR